VAHVAQTRQFVNLLSKENFLFVTSRSAVGDDDDDDDYESTSSNYGSCDEMDRASLRCMSVIFSHTYCAR
jgi:hypothetical protein